MVGEDLTSAQWALPPRPTPRPWEEVALLQLAGELAGRAEELGFLQRWFWGEGVCLLAMARLVGAPEVAPELQTFLTRYSRVDPIIEHVNNLAPASAAVLVWERTGDARARRLAEDCLAWYESTAESGRAADGTLEHWPGGVWADTVYMAGSFLARAGAAFDRPDLTAEAVRQWLLHADHLISPEHGLAAHGTHGGVSNRCWWGRANAWMALAAVDLLGLAHGDESLPQVKDAVVRQLLTLADLQPDHGVWDVLVDGQAENAGVLETSAAAGIGAAMLRLVQVCSGTLDPDVARRLATAGELACRAALGYVEDGVLTRVSAGTVLQLVPFGYSVIRSDQPQPWGQGLAIEACAALLGRTGLPAAEG